MRPFFSYFGSKYRIAKKYPAPLQDVIIEPFAGSAGYSTRYPEKSVILYDKDPIVFGIWDFLIKASSAEILSIPDTVLDVEDDLFFHSQEVKWLVGFWLSKGSASPRKTPSAWNREWTTKGYKAFWGKEIKQRLASQVEKIKHWQIFNTSYINVPSEKATWFIDPPYQGKCGKSYKMKDIDYSHLANWCRSREGQTIVCENSEANWLPFSPFITTATTQGKNRKGFSQEVVWYQESANWLDFL